MAKRRQSKKISSTVKEYRKQRSRVLATVRRYEKQGLYVDFVVPNIPKKITQASVRRLAKITPKQIQQKTYELNEYGEIEASFYQFKKKQRNRNKIKLPAPGTMSMPEEADMAISNFRGYVSQFNETAVTIINDWLNRLLFKYSEEEVGRMIQDAAEGGQLISYKVVYDRDKLLNALSSMLDYMALGTLEREKLIESLEYEENYEI
jgi:hypothetical protein